MLRRFSGSEFRANRLILVVTALILSLLSFSFTPAHAIISGRSSCWTEPTTGD